MARMRRYATPALILGLLLLGTVTRADDFAAMRQSLQNAYNAGNAADRLVAVKSVASFGDERSVRLLVSYIPKQIRLIDALVAEREAIRNGRSKEVGNRSPGPFLLVVKKKLDDEYKVIQAIETDGFAKLHNKKAIKYLAETALLRARHWKAREMVARVLATIGGRNVIPPLGKALRDKDARVKTAALLSLGALRAEEEVKAILKVLEDKDWMVRSAAIEALGKIRDSRAIEPLLERLEAEEGILRDDTAKALERITGQELGDAIQAWKAWWAKNRTRVLAGERPESEPEKPPPPNSAEKDRYHELVIKSKRTIFIIDVSESMSYSTEEYQEKPKRGEISRLQLAQRELARTLRKYGENGTFAVIAFHTLVKAWRPGMVKATRVMKEDSAEWVEALVPTGTTNIYAALELAFQMAGMGVYDKYYPPAADTIYLLSDGAPTNEDLSADDFERILRAVREWNRLGRMKIHTIGLKGHSVEFMSRLAKENGGTYVSKE
jgi:HEAT repeat protein